MCDGQILPFDILRVNSCAQDDGNKGISTQGQKCTGAQARKSVSAQVRRSTRGGANKFFFLGGFFCLPGRWKTVQFCGL